MRSAIIPLFAVLIGFCCSFVKAGQDQNAPQNSSQKAAPPKSADPVTDPAAMAGDQPPGKKPVVVGGAPVEKTYIIGAEDKIQVWVLEQAGISGAFTVRPDGIISVPMAGAIKAAGLTTAQVEEEIAERLKANEILNNPSVTVGVLESHSRKYYVAGEVNHPGAFDLVVPIHVSEALINAGGFKDFANKKKIRIIREVPGGKPKVFPYNDKDVSHGKNMDQNILLEPGDRIYVD